MNATRMITQAACALSLLAACGGRFDEAPLTPSENGAGQSQTADADLDSSFADHSAGPQPPNSGTGDTEAIEEPTEPDGAPCGRPGPATLQVLPGEGVSICDDDGSTPTLLGPVALSTVQYIAIYLASPNETECDYQALIQWAESNGFTIDNTYSDLAVLDVSATTGTLKAVLHVEYNAYLASNGTEFDAPDRDPTLSLSVPVQLIGGLNSCGTMPPHPRL